MEPLTWAWILFGICWLFFGDSEKFRRQARDFGPKAVAWGRRQTARRWRRGFWTLVFWVLCLQMVGVFFDCYVLLGCGLYWCAAVSSAFLPLILLARWLRRRS
jgi:hypothetical protein